MFPSEDVTDLLDRIADLEIERDEWKERAESAWQGLRVALSHLEEQEPQIVELRRQLENAQRLLDHALRVAS